MSFTNADPPATISPVNISIRAFASYREAIGQRQLRLDVAPGSTAAVVWDTLRARYPRLAALPTPFAYAVNDRYVPAETVLRERDELVLVPPVSGGTEQPDEPLVALVDRSIDVNELLARVRHPRAGAAVLFLGTVRDTRGAQRVHHLEYEAYGEMALREMRHVCAEAAERWPVLRVAMTHRLGTLAVGEISVAIAVSSPHRADAFAAAKYAIDTLKQRVPIWKKEVWEGGEAWVGSES